ncbi:MAG: FtsX-like permease family protein, partial [Candidatus Poribacteria bacterium]|nr:FtsX-like permease family protein [Candidatus Poribacteria bacterium]
FDMSGMVTRVDIRCDNPDYADQVKKAIIDKHGLQYVVYTWAEQRGSFFEIMQMERVVLSLILGFIIVVASFSIATNLIMLVREKTREIGILKTMGTPRNSIARVFMMYGAIIGVLGSAIGTPFGFLVCWAIQNYVDMPGLFEVYQINTIPVLYSPRFIIVINLIVMGICWVASLYPAFRAAGLKPVDAIRYE